VASEANPVGFLAPKPRDAGYALRLAEASKLDEAWRVQRTLPEQPLAERVWKLMVAGAIHEQAGAMEDAEQALGHAASLALVAHLAGAGGTDSGRLAAHALNRLGILQRRRESLDEALQTHRLVLLLREQCGSIEERWESQVELGVDCELSRTPESAIEWHQKAIETAAGLTEKQAIAWVHLAGRDDDALDAARQALQLWAAFDPAAVAVPRAQAKLGGALVTLAGRLHAADAPRARMLLCEALACLAASREALDAFGPAALADSHACAEQHDFAQRLLATL
jgi:hypothetical protein